MVLTIPYHAHWRDPACCDCNSCFVTREQPPVWIVDPNTVDTGTIFAESDSMMCGSTMRDNFPRRYDRNEVENYFDLD